MAGTIDENTETCKSIANKLEGYMQHEIYRCPECGEIITWDDNNYNEETDEYTCPHCNEVFDKDYMDELSIYDYLSNEDIFNIEYRISGNKEYKSVELMIACGGPNIYIDTSDNKVKLFWWFDKAEYPLSQRVCEAIDDYFEELYTA